MITKEQIATARDIVIKALTHSEKPVNLGLDLDGVLDENPKFFSILTDVWPGAVYIITFRDDKAKAQADLERLGIKYTDLILVNSFAEKAEAIYRLAIDVYFGDQDAVLKHIPEGVTVLMMRNGGNYDFSQKKWLFSSATGRLV